MIPNFVIVLAFIIIIILTYPDIDLLGFDFLNRAICLLSTLKREKKKRKETPYFDCFGSALFPETRDRIQHETQVEQLQQSNPQDA